MGHRINDTILLIATVAGAMLYASGTACWDVLLGRLGSLGQLVAHSLAEGLTWTVMVFFLEGIVARALTVELLAPALAFGGIWGLLSAVAKGTIWFGVNQHRFRK